MRLPLDIKDYEVNQKLRKCADFIEGMLNELS